LSLSGNKRCGHEKSGRSTAQICLEAGESRFGSSDDGR
jgi:hypothetical protein